MSNDLLASTPVPPLLPADLVLGPVHLIVTDLARSVDFYERAIGLQTDGRDGSLARLGAGRDTVLVMHERQGARPAGRHAGLYHFALLHPTRPELARAVSRLAATGTRVQGASDHGISEAIYLPDPDGNGIELAADRPRERWATCATRPRSAPPRSTWRACSPRSTARSRARARTVTSRWVTCTCTSATSSGGSASTVTSSASR